MYDKIHYNKKINKKKLLKYIDYDHFHKSNYISLYVHS